MPYGLPSNGLLMAGGIGNALSQGVDAFLKAKGLRLEQENEEKAAQQREQQMGLLAAKEGMVYSPELGSYQLTPEGYDDRQRQKQRDEAELGLIGARAAEARAHARMRTGAGGLGPQTDAEKAADRDYGKRYNEFSEKGRNNAANAIAKLEELADAMEADPSGGGGRFVGASPDVLLPRKTIEIRDLTRNSANTTLKELFGGQLSDAEREAAAKEYYNEGLDNATNARILRQKIFDLRSNLESQDEKAKYYEANRTVRGFKQSPVKERPRRDGLLPGNEGDKNGGWTPDKEKRLQELRAKQNKGKKP